MLTSVAHVAVLLFGALILVMSVLGSFAPDRLIRLVKAVMSRSTGLVFAVAVRVALGLALILIAPVSRFPLAFAVLGWIAIVAAVVLAFMGRERVGRLVNWFAQLNPSFIRLWLLFGVIFGGFLIYGVY